MTSKWHTAGWSLTKFEGVSGNIVFFCSCTNFFFPLGKRSKSLTLIVGFFCPDPDSDGDSGDDGFVVEFKTDMT